MFAYNNSGQYNIYIGGNFTSVAGGLQPIQYGAVYYVGWGSSPPTPFTTIGQGNFNSLINSFAPSVVAGTLLFTGAFSFTENSELINRGGWSELANPLTPVRSFNIATLGVSGLVRNGINLNNGATYNFFITDDKQVWYGVDNNSWEDGGIASSVSGNPTGIILDGLNPYVLMPNSTSGVRQGSPLSYLYYSIDSGSGFSTWTLSPTGSVPDVTFSSISLDLLSGQNGVAAGINNISLNPVVYFTSDGGLNWSASTGLPSIATSSIHVSIFDSNALVGINSPTTVSPSFSEYRVYYSTNGGSSWLIWNISPPAIKKGQAANVAVSSSSMIVLTTDNEGPQGNTKIYRSIDNGLNFTLNGINNLFFVLTNSSLSLSGSKSVACGQSGVGSKN